MKETLKQLDIWNNDITKRTTNHNLNKMLSDDRVRGRTSQGVLYYTDPDGINVRGAGSYHRNGDNYRASNKLAKELKNKISGY